MFKLTFNTVSKIFDCLNEAWNLNMFWREREIGSWLCCLIEEPNKLSIETVFLNLRKEYGFYSKGIAGSCNRTYLFVSTTYQKNKRYIQLYDLHSGNDY